MRRALRRILHEHRSRERRRGSGRCRRSRHGCADLQHGVADGAVHDGGRGEVWSRRAGDRGLELRPEDAGIARALERILRHRAEQQLLDLLRNVKAEARRARRPRLGIDGLEQAVGERSRGPHLLAGHALEQHHRKRVHVGVRADLADRCGELLRRAIRRRAEVNAHAGLDAGPHADRLVGHDLGEPEIEHLHANAFAGPREKEIARLHVAVNDVVAVCVRETERRAVEQLHRGVERARLQLLRASLLELGAERAAVEPLEDHVRRVLLRRGRDERAAADAAHDVEVPLRQAIEELRLVAEAAGERFADGLVGLLHRGDAEALDGDGLTEALVVAAIDEPEAAGVDARVEADLVNGAADEAEHVDRAGRAAHAPQHTCSPISVLRSGRWRRAVRSGASAFSAARGRGAILRSEMPRRRSARPLPGAESP